MDRYGAPSQFFIVAADGAAHVSKPGPVTTPCTAAGRTAAGAPSASAAAAPVILADFSMERAAAPLAPYEMLISTRADGTMSMSWWVTSASVLDSTARPSTVAWRVAS